MQKGADPEEKLTRGEFADYLAKLCGYNINAERKEIFSDVTGGTMYAGADMAFALGKTRHGVGLVFEKDAIGLFAHQRFCAQYAYQQRLFGGRLGIGVEVDMLNEKVDGSKADLIDPNDPAFPASEMTGSKFDVSVGLFYQRKGLQVGLSAAHLTSPTIFMGETNEIKVKSLYNFLNDI